MNISLTIASMALNFSLFDVKLNSASNDALYMDVRRHLIVEISAKIKQWSVLFIFKLFKIIKLA